MWIDPNDLMTKAALNDNETEEWIDILGNGQLKKKVIKKGKSGSRPNRSDMCTLKIIGKLCDGTIIEEHESLKIQLGDVEVIQVCVQSCTYKFSLICIAYYFKKFIYQIFLLFIASNMIY